MQKCIESKKNVLDFRMLSPDRILELSYGEVTTAETVNYKNYHPSSTGLFSETIFGPLKDMECRCGKYKRIRYKGIICDRCGVMVTYSHVRRERMGHIELGCNVILPQYLYGEPSILATVLDIPQYYLQQIVFGNLHINVKEYWKYNNKLRAIDNYTSEKWSECGTEGILNVLRNIDISYELAIVNEKIQENTGYLSQSFRHRREILELFKKSGNRPEWMITPRVLVLPPELRPIYNYFGKIYASEINNRYITIINRARLLKKLERKSAPAEVIVLQKRMLQLAVDTLFDKSLAREEYEKSINSSLLQRRKKTIVHYVDYSARGNVIRDSDIDFERIGIPVDVALELFKPFVAYELVASGLVDNTKCAYMQIDKRSETAKKALVILENTFIVIVSNEEGRIAAFKVSLVNGDYFKLNPLVYNLLHLEDYHSQPFLKLFVQLSDDSAEEALEKLGIQTQIISAYTEKIQLIPDSYARKWLSEMSKISTDKERRFISKGEAFCAFENGAIDINELINIRCRTVNGFEYNETTTVGRLIINDFLPQNMGIINRVSLKNKYRIEHNYVIEESQVIDLCNRIYIMFGAKEYLNFLRNYYLTMNRYYYSVNVETENTVKLRINRANTISFSKEIDYLKRKVTNLKLGDGKGRKYTVKINYSSNYLQNYISKYLINRRIAEDVYDFADKIVSDGDIITESTLDEIRNCKIDNISIYTDSVNNGMYSKYAFGKEVNFNPFIISLMAIKDALYNMPSVSGELFFKIIFENEYIVRNELLDSLIIENEGYIGKLIHRIEEGDGQGLNLSKLTKDEIIEVKTFLLYTLLEKHNIDISLRLLGLIIEADMYNGKKGSVSEEIIQPGKNTVISSLGEWALKTPSIDLNSSIIKEVYGGINLNTNYQETQLIDLNEKTSTGWRDSIDSLFDDDFSISDDDFFIDDLFNDEENIDDDGDDDWIL